MRQPRLVSTGTFPRWALVALLVTGAAGLPLAAVAEPEAPRAPAASPKPSDAAERTRKTITPPKLESGNLAQEAMKLQAKDPQNGPATMNQIHEAQKKTAQKAAESANYCVPACKGVFFCSQGVCKHPCVTSPDSCDDQDPCTKDMCLPADGCASIKILGCISLP